VVNILVEYGAEFDLPLGITFCPVFRVRDAEKSDGADHLAPVAYELRVRSHCKKIAMTIYLRHFRLDIPLLRNPIPRRFQAIKIVEFSTTNPGL
jgi:hypothetical protein